MNPSEIVFHPLCRFVTPDGRDRIRPPLHWTPCRHAFIRHAVLPVCLKSLSAGPHDSREEKKTSSGPSAGPEGRHCPSAILFVLVRKTSAPSFACRHDGCTCTCHRLSCQAPFCRALGGRTRPLLLLRRAVLHCRHSLGAFLCSDKRPNTFFSQFWQRLQFSLPWQRAPPHRNSMLPWERLRSGPCFSSEVPTGRFTPPTRRRLMPPLYGQLWKVFWLKTPMSR